MAGGFRDFLRKLLGWRDSSSSLETAQKTLGGIPSFSLTIGGYDLSAYIVAYIYEEAAHRAGGLTLWLENRDDRFDDLATDYPNLVHGVAVDFHRGLVIDGTPARRALPRTWLESVSWSEGGQMILTCIDWLGLLERFYYSSTTTFSSQAHSAIASSILGQVGLTLAAGSFGYSTDFEVGRFENGREALQRLMNLCHEKLYAGLGGEIQYKRLDSTEAAGYSYDFSTGGGSNHPLLPGTEVWSAAAPFNTVTVTGAIDESFSGSATNAAQVALVGTRRVNFRVVELASNAQCTEVAESWLDEFLSRLNGGVILARPHFTLRLYDVLSIAAAPPWGGPTSTGRARQIFERFNRVNGRWEQELVLGDVPFQALAQRARIGEIR